MKVSEVVEMLSQACEDAGSQQSWAEANGLSPQYVNDVLKGRREPGQSIATALGLSKRSEYDELPATKPRRRAG